MVSDRQMVREYPVWAQVYQGCAHTPDWRDQELIAVTRHTLHLAHSALQAQNARDYYHNYGAAEREIANALAAYVSKVEKEK